MYNLYRDGSELSSISHTSSPISQSWRQIKSNYFKYYFYVTSKFFYFFLFNFVTTANSNIPIPRPRSISSKKSANTNGSSERSLSVNSLISNKSTIINSRSVTPESVSVELSDDENTDHSSKIVSLK